MSRYRHYKSPHPATCVNAPTDGTTLSPNQALSSYAMRIGNFKPRWSILVAYWMDISGTSSHFIVTVLVCCILGFLWGTVVADKYQVISIPTGKA